MCPSSLPSYGAAALAASRAARDRVSRGFGLPPAIAAPKERAWSRFQLSPIETAATVGRGEPRRRAALAALPDPARLRHGAGRRRDAADGIRPLDHRVESRDRHGAAARRRRLAGGVRALPAKPAIRSPEPGHEPRRRSRRSTGGNGRIASSGASSASSTSPASSGSSAGAACRSGRRSRPRRHGAAPRRAGRRRLDHGRLGARAWHDGGRAGPARAAPDARRAVLRGARRPLRPARRRRAGGGVALASDSRRARSSCSPSCRSRSAGWSRGTTPASPTTPGR